MSTDRWKRLPLVRQDKAGYYLCRLCQNACPEHQKYWCSEDCLRRFLTISNGTYVRAVLFERDHGICAECGVNAAQMDAALAHLKSDLLHPLLMSIHPMIAATFRAEGWSNIKLRGKGSYPDAIAFTSCWEAHHVKSVIEGGGECSLLNYKTLCFVCHKKISAAQAHYRAQQRQTQKRAAKSAPETAPVLLLDYPADDDVIPF